MAQRKSSKVLAMINTLPVTLHRPTLSRQQNKGTPNVKARTDTYHSKHMPQAIGNLRVTLRQSWAHF